MATILSRPHALTPESVADKLDVDPQEGLTGREVSARRREHGRNRLREARRRSPWSILIDQVKSVVLLLLVVAGALAFAFGQWPEGFAIIAVIAVNSLIGFVSEWRATRSMEALRRIGKREARVRRDGGERSVPVSALVPGDIVIVEGGDLVPADIRLHEANGLRVDESALTGESVAVVKRVEPVDEETPLAEREGMTYKGTTVVEGSGEGIVVATGMDTELGKIAEMVGEEEKETSPLQRRLDRLGHRLAWITLGLAAVIAGVGLLSGQPTLLMIETAIALGVAAIPEGLPIVATIALARGMWLMARRQVLVNRLPAVETLGATRIIFTDKTGTLTENRMLLSRIVTPSGSREFAPHHPRGEAGGDDGSDVEDEPAGAGGPSRGDDAAGGAPEEGRDESENAPWRWLLRLGVLCNNATLGGADGEEAQGDPTEIALLERGAELGIRRGQLLESLPEVREVAFDPDEMMMATFHELDSDFLVAVKGAPGAVLDACDRMLAEGVEAAPPSDEDPSLNADDRERWLERAEELAAEGLRVLAVADKRVGDREAEPYSTLRFVGLVGLLDPWRPDVGESIAACRRAGIEVLMATGDLAQTARAVGEQVGLLEEGNGRRVLEGRELVDPDELSDEERRRVLGARIFARVSPEQKLHLIRIYQENEEIVAMTGDGVNDAPALKKANIGVAMGRRGTDAARQAADMVLKDDALSSIVAAVEQGRIIFRNIRKSAIFMLCTNVAEVTAVAVASAIGVPLPLLPLQILYLNMLTDVLPALALGVGEGDESIMRRPPRPPGESVLTRRHWDAIGGWSTGIAACVLGSLGVALYLLEMNREAAVTVSFLTLAFAKLWFVFNLRDRGSRLLDNDVVRNPWIWGSLGVCSVLLVAAVYLPGLSDILRTRSPGLQGWALILIASLPVTLVGQAMRIAQSTWQNVGGAERDG